MRTAEIITAKSIVTTDEELVLNLEDATVRIPWSKCSPVMAKATPEQRRTAELSPGGYGIQWPLLNEDLSIAGLLRDREPQRRVPG